MSEIDLTDRLERIAGCINNAEYDDEQEALTDAFVVIEAQAAEIERLRGAVDALLQHEASSFFGPDADKHMRASWRGVIRKAKKARAGKAEIERLRELIKVTGDHWLALQHKHPIQWEGAIDGAMAAACAEIERLREALRTIENGSVKRPVGKSWFPDLRPSKHDQCIHGIWMYEPCEGCTDAFIAEALAGKAEQ